MAQALTFNDVSFVPVPHNNQPWIRSAELARALAYSDERKVTHLYNRHADEFSSDMSVVLNLGTMDQPCMTRIFSLRGCHLLAMFARTPVAKAFRVWVLDVLERLNLEGQPRPVLESITAPSTASDRAPLRSLVNAWSQASGLHQSALWPQVKAYFQLSTIEDLPLEWIPDALAFVQGKIDALQGVKKQLALPADPGAELEPHFLRIRLLVREIHEHERSIYDVIKQHRGGVLKAPDARRSVYVNMNTVCDGLFYALDSMLESAEYHAKSMCIMSRV